MFRNLLDLLRQQQINNTIVEDFEYFNQMVDFGTNNHVTFDQVVNGEIDYVHPSVLYLDTPWNGYRYWMGVNPYPNTVGTFENPYLFYSEDGETWLTLSGTPTPIKPLEADTGNNSDAHIYIEDNTMYYFNRGVLTAGGAYIDVFSSTDAINWSSRTRIINSNDVGFSDYVSPSLVKRGSTYYLFGTDPNEQTVLCVLSSTSITGTWTEINRMSLGNAGSLWHPEVRWHEDRFILLSSNNFISGGNLMLGQFFDVTDTEIETRNTFLLPRNDQTWNVAYYKSSFIIKNDGTMELYLGCKGEALNSNTDWRVQKVIASKLPQTLDLSDYELVNIYPFADVSNGFTDGMKDLNYNLIALQCTLVNPWDFNIQVARAGTTDFNRFNITGTITYYRNWGKPPFADEPLLYGIKAGDEITIIKDELIYTIYVNGVASFTTICDSQLDYNRGTLFGDFLNNGSIQSLKVYMKPEWIFSTENFDEHITFMNTESSVIPSQYILGDNFDRTLLGSQDDLGNTYTIVGSPNIVSDTNFRGSGGFIGINHSESDYSIYVESVDNRTGKIYLNYTDSNNLRYLEFQDFNDKFLKLQTIDSGVTTTTELDILKYHENYSRWQIEIVGDSIIKIYGDNVLLKSATLAANANPKFVGLGGAYATNQYNNFFVRKTAPVYTDVTAPSAPTNLIASNIVDVSMDLSWTASTDDFVVFNYKIYNNDILLHDIRSSNTNYTLTGLTPSTNYNLTVRAYDFAGNESTNSNIEAVSTLAPDTEAPTAPTSFLSTNITTTTVDLTWVASTDNFGVVDYKIYNNDVLIATVGSNTTSYKLIGLVEATLYSLTVRALDLAGNESSNSNVQSFNTASPLDDAQAFIDAVGTLTVPQEEAIRDLVSGLKANGTWSKYHAIYPVIGGTASSHKWNLKDPRDLDAAYRLTFVGDAYKFTHNSDGMSNSAPLVYIEVYADTHYIPSVNLVGRQAMLSYYCPSYTSSNNAMMGYLYNSNNSRLCLERVNELHFNAYNWDERATFNNTSAGWIVGSRISDSDSRLFLNGTQIGSTQTSISTRTVPTGKLFLLALNNGLDVARDTMLDTISFATIGEGLTPTEIANDYTVIQKYQTALGRQI